MPIENPTHHTCSDCGYTWAHGQHGGHSCATVMKKTIAGLEGVRDHLRMQASIQAQEARTQKSIVMEIGTMVGCDQDFLVAEAVRAELTALRAQEPAQVMGRVYDGKAELNSIGRSLADGSALYASPVAGQVGGVDPDMVLPCDIKLPGGMQIGKGCKLSTLLLSFRNRGDDVPWRQRFSVPVPYDPALLSINPAPAKAEPAITSVDQLFADTKCLLCGDTGHVPIDDPVDADITTVPCWVCSDADHLPTGIDSEGGSHD